ncbi:type II CAAX prenyl endopeptidase Rce1 family protein [Microbacterium enclense]|uniref:CPBP family glutamic-type intramembrane protease n=1 Tax=Microbacterium enclense TaxID=993073 RepID=UPI0036DF35CB
MEQTLESPPDEKRARRRPPRRTWREGGSSTARWTLELLGWALLSLGAGVLLANAAALLLPAAIAAPVAQAAIWLGFAVPIVLAFRRSRPRGLLRFRALDLMYGLVFGVALRLADGALQGMGGTPAPWPTTFSVDGSLPDGFALEAALGSIVAPTLEEFFFRGVVLVTAYSVFRRMSGQIAGGVAAAAVSTGLFVIAHLLVEGMDATGVLALVLLGVVASALVLGTGRIWAAVVSHIVFNATGFLLVAVGTMLS